MSAALLKRLLYRTGALGLLHRLRNRRTLTVVMFHRVLAPDDPRWASCDPDYTLRDDLFRDCLAFFRRHYHVVSLDQVLAAVDEGAPLPPRALLLSFDDGWADNHDHALPALRAAGMPAVLFTVADAVGSRQPFFQERLVAALRRGALSTAELAAALAAEGQAVTAWPEGLPGLRQAIAVLETLDAPARERVLARLAGRLDDGLRHMVDAGELAALAGAGVAIGLHGKSHVPMTRADDLDAELAGARSALARHLPGQRLDTLSYPHGRYDAAIAARTRAAGYRLAGTSVPAINPAHPRPSWLLARLGFEQAGITDGTGRFLPERLALYLFRAPHAVPAGA